MAQLYLTVLSSMSVNCMYCYSTASRILQILDHVGIYMVIAGTLTPFSLITLNHHTSARVFITAEWIFAVLGSIFASTISSVPISSHDCIASI